MDFPDPFHPTMREERIRGPVAVWLVVLAIGVVLGGAAIAAAYATDTRDFSARHHTVLRSQAL